MSVSEMHWDYNWISRYTDISARLNTLHLTFPICAKRNPEEET
jgi:hypothetical protein